MSLSKEERLANVEYALSLFVKDIGDTYYKEAFITPDGDNYQKLFPTTWHELLGRRYIKQPYSTNHYILTEAGWIWGLRFAGIYDDEVFRKRLGNVSRALKDRVKGRSEAALATAYDIAQSSGEPVGFVQSVIDSDILRALFNRVSAEWHKGTNGSTVIYIPPNFGLELLY
jgi:hypothetical protein